MRISDWSSDVCSSDLHETSRGAAAKGGTVGFFADCRSWERTSFQGLRDVERRCRRAFQAAGAISRSDSSQIGRASCRERDCQYVSISVVDVSLKKKAARQYQHN